MILERKPVMLGGMSAKGRDRVLFLKLTVFYALLFGGASLAFNIYPDLGSHLPVGELERLISRDTGAGNSLDGIEIQASQVQTKGDSVVWLVTAILGAVVLMVPVSWTYLSIRQLHQLDQSLLQSMLILPIAVSGIVLVVHNSLALAFSLAGVVAGVRFRHTVKSAADSIFIFMAVGVGLSAGIGMLIVGAIMTLIFNYTVLVLWSLNYGLRKEAKTYMRSSEVEADRGDDFENELTG